MSASEHHLDASNVALRPVADEDIGGTCVNVAVESLCDRFAQRSLSLFGAVSSVLAVSVERSESLGGLDHAVDDRLWDGFGGIPDTETDDLRVWVRFEVFVTSSRDLGEQVSRLQFD